MHRVDGDSQLVTALTPVLPLANAAVGDVAQGAVASSHASTEPIGQLASKGAIGVVHTHESQDLGSLAVGLRLHATIVPPLHRWRDASATDPTVLPGPRGPQGRGFRRVFRVALRRLDSERESESSHRRSSRWETAGSDG